QGPSDQDGDALAVIARRAQYRMQALQCRGEHHEGRQAQQNAGLAMQEVPVMQCPADAAETAEAEQQGTDGHQQVQWIAPQQTLQQTVQCQGQQQADQHSLQGLVAGVDLARLAQRYQ